MIISKLVETSARIIKTHPYLWPESGEPSPYETKPPFSGGLPEDDLDLDLSLFACLGDCESSEDFDIDELLLRGGDLCLSARGDSRNLDVSIGERLRIGLRL